MMTKMAELSAPLAQLNEDWGEDFGDFQQGVVVSSEDLDNRNVVTLEPVTHNGNTKPTSEPLDNAGFGDPTNLFDSNSGSLEDLVNSFDEKISNCFKDYDEESEKIAPVQIRSQEEIINDCQVWWTLTGTFGNILPIDWTKTHTRKMYLPTLNLNQAAVDMNVLLNDSNQNGTVLESNTDEEELAKDLDLHSLIISSHANQLDEPLFTAEQVLEEIDELMHEDDDGSSCGSGQVTTNGDSEAAMTPMDTGSDGPSLEAKSVGISSYLHRDRLKSVTSGQLNELYIELERMIQDYSETLIQQLALRDELEFEKELKNSFISLLLQIQNRRRQHHIEKKKGRNGNDLKYLTTVIPYSPDSGQPEVPTLQVLIKILRAINDDSPTVPTLLTDYILRVLVPT
ncbi:Fasciculation and elongation protein zeta-2 [Halotydeus destructor]|nr:Fasciculation and elongation protein zeta-2 [Halotydeus destructor]